MPIRPSSGKKGGKPGSASSGKKGKKKGSKTPAIDPHQEEIDRLIHEREEIRSKLNLLCKKILENVNLDDYQNDIDLTKQQPSDISIEHLFSMIDQICYYRIAFLNLFQETDDQENVPIDRKITQLSIDQPEIFQKRLTADQRLTFVIRERDLWKENAQLLQIMYATIVDQLEMEIFKKPNAKTDDILRTHRFNLEDVSLIFSAPRIRSINDAQKLRAKKNLDDVLNNLREQHAFFDLDPQSEKQKDISDNTNKYSNDTPLKSQLINRSNQQSSLSARRSVSFADEVNVYNDDDDIDLQQRLDVPSTILSNEQESEENLNALAFQDSSSLIGPNQDVTEEKFNDSDYYSSSSLTSFQQQQNHHHHHQSPQQQYHHHHHSPQQYQQQQYDVPIETRFNLPSKYRLPLGSEVLVNKMDSNLRMLVIKELSKSGHTERPLSRMSSAYGASSNSDSNSRRSHHSRSRSDDASPEWVELARLIGIDESEIDHWLSQNLQYPAGRVISAWCNYASPPPTVAQLHSALLSNELNRPDLARYIETMYIIQ